MAMNQTPLGMDEKTTCILSWVLQLVLGFIAPLVVFLTCPQNPWARRQAALGLTLHIATFVAGIACAVLSVIGIGIVLALLLAPLTMVIVIWGTVESSQDRDFNPPILSDLCRAIFSV